MSESANHVEHLGLKEQFSHALEEARIVMPGVQALFGFQLIAVFNPTFEQKLTPADQRLHLLAIALAAIAAALNMAPAALHRMSSPECVSDRMVRFATALLSLALVPLMAAILIDFYLLCEIILASHDAALGWTFALSSVFVGLWFVAPRWFKGRINKPAPLPQEPPSRTPSSVHQ